MKICVIGGGSMGANHIRTLKSLGHEVVVVEPSVARHSNLQSLFGVKTYADLVETKEGSIDAYIIATPTTTHFSIAKWILENNKKPILIEKPICTTVQEAEEIKRLATDTLVMVGHVEHYNSIVHYTKQFIESSKVKLIKTQRLGFNNRIKDSGVVSDLAIHDLGVVRYLIGSKITEVFSNNLVNPDTGHETYGSLSYRFENGTIGTTEVSWIHPERIRKIEIVMEDSSSNQLYVIADYLTQTLTSNMTDYNGLARVSQQNTLKPQESLKLELEDFINAIQNNTTPRVTIDDGIEALRVVEVSYESHKTGKVVKI